MDKIKNVYLGLPKSLAEAVLWVSREYRKNPLSHEPGGSDVIVEYHSDTVLGYDWIKFPSKYVDKIWTSGMIEEYDDYQEWDEESQMEEIKNVIKRIYARKYKKENFETVPFKEIWNSETSKEMPWKTLEDYDNWDW
jgi:hypothetical protein